jgi:hypothetical protein
MEVFEEEGAVCVVLVGFLEYISRGGKEPDHEFALQRTDIVRDLVEVGELVVVPVNILGEQFDEPNL